MHLTIKIIGFKEVAQIWPLCEPLIALGLEPSDGEASSQHVLSDLLAQKAHLVVATDVDDQVHCAMAVQFSPYPNYTVAHVCSIGGTGVIENEENWAIVKAWMKQQGASKVQGVCKPAQARLWQKLGFVDTYHLVRQAL